MIDFDRLTISVESMQLTTLIDKGNTLRHVPVVYHINGQVGFFVNVAKKDYKRLVLPFYYKHKPVIFK